MPDRLRPLCKVICLAFAALVVYQASSLFARRELLASRPFAFPASSAPPPVTRPGAETNLPPAIQARVDKITQSEILGPVVRPLPMALLGIGGRDAFVRTPDGQTGLMREGDELNGVKLLRIGTNRVLIEHAGQQKELTVFSGFGSEPLLPKESRSTK